MRLPNKAVWRDQRYARRPLRRRRQQLEAKLRSRRCIIDIGRRRRRLRRTVSPAASCIIIWRQAVGEVIELFGRAVDVGRPRYGVTGGPSSISLRRGTWLSSSR